MVPDCDSELASDTTSNVPDCDISSENALLPEEVQGLEPELASSQKDDDAQKPSCPQLEEKTTGMAILSFLRHFSHLFLFKLFKKIVHFLPYAYQDLLLQIYVNCSFCECFSKHVDLYVENPSSKKTYLLFRHRS